MAIIIFQPKGAGTAHRNGTVTVQAPLAAGTGWYNNANIKIDSYPHSVVGTDTGVINSSYSGRFDDTRYYTGDTST